MICSSESVSLSVTASAHRLPRPFRTHSGDPRRVRLYEWGVALPTIAGIAYFAATRWDVIVRDGLDLIVWGVLMMFVALMPISYSKEIHQTMGLPVVLAAGMVLAPYQVALVALIAASDPREFRGQVGLGRACFNHSQEALSAASASIIFHVLHGNPDAWPSVLWIALTALGAEVLVNWLTVTTAAVLATGDSFRRVTRDVFLGAPIGFALSYGAVGLLALLIAAAKDDWGYWGLAASVIPLTVARQMFLHRRRSALASSEVAEKQQLLAKATQQIAVERRDERARVAAALHDEVLPALFRVHLMGEILRQDLDSGKLLALEEDVPELRVAANEASNQIRALIRNLHRSSVGIHGLESTLELLIEEVRTQTSTRIIAEIHEVEAPSSLQLLIYQIAREALHNAVVHADAKTIMIRLFTDASDIRLIIRDDGDGFLPESVDRERHFGLQLMAERAEQGGGLLHIETHPGEGTQVTARFPTGSILSEDRSRHF
jgi:signal transduction histidine kinase